MFIVFTLVVSFNMFVYESVQVVCCAHRLCGHVPARMCLRAPFVRLRVVPHIVLCDAVCILFKVKLLRSDARTAFARALCLRAFLVPLSEVGFEDADI